MGDCGYGTTYDVLVVDAAVICGGAAGTSMTESLEFLVRHGAAVLVRSGVHRTNGRSATRHAMIAGGGRFERHRQNELVGSAQCRRGWLGARRFDLVLFGTSGRPARVELALPHLIGTGLVRSPDARPLHAIQDARRRCGEIHSGLGHAGAAAGGQLWRGHRPIPFLRWMVSLLYGGCFISNK